MSSDVTTPFDAEVEVRYRGTPHPARVSAAGPGRFRVEFATPVSPVVRGQYAVFYQGNASFGRRPHQGEPAPPWPTRGDAGMRALASLAAIALTFGCAVGEGSGNVTSDRLYIDGCWNGPFELDPDFFAANPFRQEALIVRVQRGDNTPEMSDGIYVVINDLAGTSARTRSITDIPLGIPHGIIVSGSAFDPKGSDAKVSIALYLHNTCHNQNGTVYSIGGTINFRSLFSGDINESDADERLTTAEFTADFADPRELTGDPEADAEVISRVTGKFQLLLPARSARSALPVKTRVDDRLRNEAQRFELRFGCEHCAHFDPPSRRMRERLPGGAPSRCRAQGPSRARVLQRVRARLRHRSDAAYSPPTLLTLASRALREECGVEKGARVLVAVSGGPDSIALLDVLGRLSSSLGLSLVAHGVDHGLREEAPAELELAAARAARLGVDFDVTKLALAPGGNLQARARDARYAALEKVAKRRDLGLLATAHHADDRAETVLLRLLRGSGPAWARRAAGP